MAIIKTVLSKGPRNFLMHVFLEQDGVDQGELLNYTLIDPVEDFGLTKGPTLRLREAWFSFAWFDLTLKFAGLVPRPVWTFARDTSNHLDFAWLGGMSDRGATVPPLGEDTGKVLITTNGFGQLGAQGTLVLAFRQ